MKITIIAIGKRMPSWVTLGYEEYSKRLPPEFQLKLIEIEAIKRTKNSDTDRIIRQEGELLLAAVPSQSTIIALSEHGKQLNSKELANQLQKWRDNAEEICLLIGGPDGLSPACLTKAQWQWSLSALTLPHPLVRVLLVEQLYRAWTITTHHPYHR